MSNTELQAIISHPFWGTVIATGVVTVLGLIFRGPIEVGVRSLGERRKMLWLFWIGWLVGFAFLVAATVSAYSAGPSPDGEGKAAANEEEQDDPQKAKIAAMRVLGYGKPVFIDESGKLVTSPGERKLAAVQKKAARSPSNDLVIQEIAITRPDGLQILFNASVLTEQRAWMEGQHHVFEGESPQGITPVKALKNYPDVAKNVQESIIALCVGLASTEGEEQPTKDNTVLSDNRSIRLCSALIELGLVKPNWALQTTIGIGLGERINEPEMAVSPSIQRAAVIIGITKVGPSDSRRDVIQAVLAQVELASIDLKKYHRDDGKPWEAYPVKSPTFREATTWLRGEPSFLDQLADVKPEGR